jgi:hypothetical protein
MLCTYNEFGDQNQNWKQKAAVKSTQTLHPNRMVKAIKLPEYHATRLGWPKATVPPFPDGVVWIRFRKNMFFMSSRAKS